MKHKSKTLKVFFIISLLALTFTYGVAVGRLHLPPYRLLHKAFSLLIKEKHDVAEHSSPRPQPVSRQTTIDHIAKFKALSSFEQPFIGKNVTDYFNYYAESLEYLGGVESIVANWDNKFLAYDNESLTLYQINNKQLYYSRLEVPDVYEIEFAFIFESGNILWCDRSECYYSHDNLQTYNKALVYDIQGQPYKPNSYGNFFSLVIDNRQFINDKEIRVWGNYTNNGRWSPGNSQSENVQIWYTVDEGKTIRTAFSFDNRPGLTGIYCRHVHAVNISPTDNSFWVQTGDYTGECHWMRGFYNYEKDVWNFEVMASGDHLSHYKTTGFVFYNDYVYWGNDAQDPQLYGVWRTPYSNFLNGNFNPDLFEHVLQTEKVICNFVGDRSGIMIASECHEGCRPDGTSKIYYSNDGGNSWETRNTYRMVLNIHPPNTFGGILGNYFDNECSMAGIHHWNKKPSLFLSAYFRN
jgi:hypothetical protein